MSRYQDVVREDADTQVQRSVAIGEFGLEPYRDQQAGDMVVEFGTLPLQCENGNAQDGEDEPESPHVVMQADGNPLVQ